MEYTVKKLAALSGVSARTLRYYDEIGLLKPARVASNGYRIYGQAQVDTLQQILFYRSMQVPLEEIRRLLSDPQFDRRQALERHLEVLERKRDQMDTLITTVRHTIETMKGERTMTDQEKFAGLKERFLEENQQKYGAELEARYGKEEVAAFNAKVGAMSPAVAGAVLAGGDLLQGSPPGHGRDVRPGRAVPGLLRGHRAGLRGIFPGRPRHLLRRRKIEKSGHTGRDCKPV